MSTLQQAQKYIYISDQVLLKSIEWILNKQNFDGSFTPDSSSRSTLLEVCNKFTSAYCLLFYKIFDVIDFKIERIWINELYFRKNMVAGLCLYPVKSANELI